MANTFKYQPHEVKRKLNNKYMENHVLFQMYRQSTLGLVYESETSLTSQFF